MNHSLLSLRETAPNLVLGGAPGWTSSSHWQAGSPEGSGLELQSYLLPFLATGRFIDLLSPLGEYQLVPGFMTPQCNKRRGMYKAMEVANVNKSQMYSPPTRRLKKSLPIQHQYFDVHKSQQQGAKEL
jgi:hypothetical protein